MFDFVFDVDLVQKSGFSLYGFGFLDEFGYLGLEYEKDVLDGLLGSDGFGNQAGRSEFKNHVDVISSAGR